MMKARLVMKPKRVHEFAHLVKSGIDSFVAQILWERGIKTVQEARRFLDAGVKDLYDPAQIRHIDKVYTLVEEAMTNNELVGIFGDYDVDGVTATAIMYLCLKDLGIDVCYRLPDRLSEGYGMSVKAVEELHAKGVKLIITVDNGIKQHKEIARAKELGMKVIILDHHTPSAELPDADVVVDLHIPGESYPFIELAGCGLAFKVACYLYEQFGFEDEGLKFLDIAAVGTVADVVPLVDENRIIVKEGLRMMNQPDYKRVGFNALMQVFNVDPGAMTSMEIAFKIAPAINAPGRLLPRGAEQSLATVLCDNMVEASSLAAELHLINEARKQESKDSLARAEEYITTNQMENDKVMVLFLPGVPEGVVGLVSGKITEKYNRPSIVFTEGHDCYKASARSTVKFNLYEALCTCDDLFIRYGGHSQAAGMSIKRDEEILKELRRRMNDYADPILSEEDLIPVIEVDDVVTENHIGYDLLKRLDQLEPFGQCNPRPVFMTRNYFLRKKQQYGGGGWSHYSYIGQDKDHLRLFGNDTECIGFGMAQQYEEMEKPRKVTIVFNLSRHIFRGQEKIQLELADLQSGEVQAKGKTELMNEMSGAIAKLMEVSSS